QPDDGLEAALEVMRTHGGNASEVVQRHRLIRMRGEIRGCAADGVDARLREADRIGPATLAGPEARLPRFDRRVEEADAIRPRPPARATGPAIDAGRRHAVDKG